MGGRKPLTIRLPREPFSRIFLLIRRATIFYNERQGLYACKCVFLCFHNSHIFNGLQDRYRGQLGGISEASRRQLGGNPRFLGVFLGPFGVILIKKLGTA